MDAREEPPSPHRGLRVNSPFTKEQAAWVVLEFGATRNITLVRRAFRLKFKISPKKVPRRNAFLRLVQRFSENAELKPQKKSGGKQLHGAEVVQRVQEFIATQRQSTSVRQVSTSLNLGSKMTWQIMRKELKLFPYKPKTVVPLNQGHKDNRILYCEWLLSKDDKFVDRILFSDEKWFKLLQAPNKQNERYWAPEDPHVQVECREQGGKKVMCWAVMIEGRMLLHWFEDGTSVNGDTYLAMLKEVLWPEVRGIATRHGLHFMQDGATPHTTLEVREWLQSKFGERVISRLMPNQWPAKSPDLSPLDYWFWGVAMQEVRSHPPATLEELKEVVDGFAESLEPEEVVKAARDHVVRARCCLTQRGGAFESRLQQFKRDIRANEE